MKIIIIAENFITSITKLYESLDQDHRCSIKYYPRVIVQQPEQSYGRYDVNCGQRASGHSRKESIKLRSQIDSLGLMSAFILFYFLFFCPSTTLHRRVRKVCLENAEKRFVYPAQNLG